MTPLSYRSAGVNIELPEPDCYLTDKEIGL